MQKVVKDYLSDLELYHRSPVTIINTKSTLLNFAKTEKKLLKVNANSIKNWIRSTNEVPVQTQLEYLKRISVFYDYLIEENLYKEKNPCKRMIKELKKAPTNRVRETNILSVDDIRGLVLKASNPRDRSILLLFYKTGLRMHELSQIQLKDIEFDNQKITIQKRKGGKKGVVFFDYECKRWLKAYLSIKKSDEILFPIGDAQIGRIIKEIGKRAGFENLRAHDFRHAFTSHLQEAKCHPEVIRVLRGDSIKDMVSYYTHFTDDKNREEYEACIPKLGV